MKPQTFRQLRLELCLPKCRFGDGLTPAVSPEMIAQWESGDAAFPRSAIKQLLQINTLFQTEAESLLRRLQEGERNKPFVFYLFSQDFLTQEPATYRRFQGNPYLYHSFLLYLNNKLDGRYGGFIGMEAYYPTDCDEERYRQQMVTAFVQAQGELSVEWREDVAIRKATGQGYPQVNRGQEMQAILESIGEEARTSSTASDRPDGAPFDEGFQDTLQSILTFYQTTPPEALQAWLKQRSAQDEAMPSPAAEERNESAQRLGQLLEDHRRRQQSEEKPEKREGETQLQYLSRLIKHYQQQPVTAPPMVIQKGSYLDPIF